MDNAVEKVSSVAECFMSFVHIPSPNLRLLFSRPSSGKSPRRQRPTLCLLMGIILLNVHRGKVAYSGRRLLIHHGKIDSDNLRRSTGFFFVYVQNKCLFVFFRFFCRLFNGN